MFTVLGVVKVVYCNMCDAYTEMNTQCLPEKNEGFINTRAHVS